MTAQRLFPITCTACENGKIFNRRLGLTVDCQKCHGTGLLPDDPEPDHDPRARSTDPDTSRAAARSIDRDALRSSQKAVLETFESWGEMTDERLLIMYGNGDRPLQSQSGLRTRRSELVDLGYLEDSGRRERLPSGRNSIVWRRKT